VQQVSVIVRTRDKARTVGRVLETLRRQTVDVEIVVVDSGSTDGTLDIVRARCDQLVEIPAEQFSYGRALNIGARTASGEILCALSAHCFPASPDWITRVLHHYSNPRVAATNGLWLHPYGLTGGQPFIQTAPDQVDRYRGFSNHASSWRRSVWEQFPFDESLEACEDKEWALRVLEAGWAIAFDPALYVQRVHTLSESPRQLYARHRREARVMSRLPGAHRFTAHDAFRTWWADFPQPSNKPTWLRRLRWRRALAIAAKYHGERQTGEGGA
jgi:rhamnosyltransferase